MRPKLGFIVAVAALVVSAGCSNDEFEAASLDPYLGGETTRLSATTNAFGLPAPRLDREGRRRFEVGDSFFTQKWVTAPASTDKRDGLGPTFNATACGACHVFDGRAAPPSPTNDLPGLLLRISVPGDGGPGGQPLGVEGYGDQIQDNAILGVPAEADIGITYSEIAGSFEDGTPWALEMPHYKIVDPQFGELPDEILVSPRLAPPVFGTGLLGAIPEQDLLDAQDPDDEDGDGISGRANMVWNQREEELTVGRFGWKANQPTVEQQVAGAFLGDMGITSELNPDENCPPIQFGCFGAPTGGSPEIDDKLFGDVVFYNRTLGVPAMRDNDDPTVLAGREIFDEIGCDACHTPQQRTRDSDIDVLSDQTIYPYTDLLIHDMGPDLADGRPDFSADGSEWRTPPLWGIGLTDDINGHTRFLHDGRARSVEEAILWHGGEAERSRNRYQSLSEKRRETLLAFLDAL